MLKTIFKIISIVLLVILQLSLFVKFTIYGAIPNMIAILAICFIIKGNFLDGLFIASLGGLLLDLSSPVSFGIYTLSLVILSTVIYYFVLRIVSEPNIFSIFLIFYCSFLLFNLFLHLTIRHLPSPYIFLSTIVEGCWGLFVYWAVGKFMPVSEEIKIN